MSEHEDDLELQALQRELEDAFATTRPRPGYEDELWLRMQSHRPAPNRIREAFAGFFQGIRAVPAVPASAIAAVVVVALVVGVLIHAGFAPRSSGTSSAPAFYSEGAQGQRVGGSFGRLPTPVFNPAALDSRAGAPAKDMQAPAQSDLTPYFGPATLTWTGQLNVTIPSAPVFRYREPSSGSADQFAAALGAAPEQRPAGFLGSYSARGYKLQVRGTVAYPPQSPTYLIVSSPDMPPVTAAGAGPADIANFFLAEHSLVPQWPNTAVVQQSGDLTKVLFIRQFDAAGYGRANLVDSQGEPYGIEVDLNGNHVVRATGLLPLSFDTAGYPIIPGDQAIKAALTPSPQQAAAGTQVPAVQLTRGDLVYVLAPAGDHSFYEPAYLFSGTFQMNGKTFVMRVMVPAIDASMRQ